MSAAFYLAGAHWAALILIAGAVAAALGAATARSLFSVTMWLLVLFALAAAFLVALQSGEAALVLALVGVGFAPIVLLATMLLSTRAAKARRRAWPWLTMLAVSAAGGATLWIAPELDAATHFALAPAGSAALWLALPISIAVLACLGLLGFGERGALERLAARPNE